MSRFEKPRFIWNFAGSGSPSAARVWAARASVNVRAACVCATSADACVELGFGRDRVFAPAKPGLAGWAGAVRDAVAALA